MTHRFLMTAVLGAVACAAMTAAAALSLRPGTEHDHTAAIEVATTVRAQRAEAWRAWTTNEGVESFFGAKANIELRIGGPYEIFFIPDAPPGERGAENLRVLSYVPMEMLSFEWNAPPHLPHARQHLTWVVLFFDRVSDNETRVRLVHLGWDEMKTRHPEHAEEWDQARAYFARVWPHVLNKLKETLEEPGK